MNDLPYIVLSKQFQCRESFLFMLEPFRTSSIKLCIIQLKQNKKYFLIRMLRPHELHILETTRSFKFDKRKHKVIEGEMYGNIYSKLYGMK